MEGAQQAAATRHVYHFKPMQRDICVVIGVVFAVAGCGVAVVAGFGGAVSSTPYLMLIPFLIAFGVYLLTLAFRSRVVIEGARLEVHGPFSMRSIDLTDVEGFRTVGSGDASSLYLLLKGGRGVFSVSSSFDTDDMFQAWLQQVPDLDERDRETLLAKIEQEQEVSNRLEDWLEKLSHAKRRAFGLFIITLVAAIALDLVPWDWAMPFAVVLLLAPFVAAYLCFQSHSLYAVFKKKNDPRAETGFVLIVAAFGLLIRLREMHFIAVQPLVLFMVVAGLALAFTNYQSSKSGSNQTAFVGILCLAALYGYSSIMVANTVFDTAKATRYSADVLGSRVAHARSTTSYYLRVGPWGPIEKESEVSVPSTLYYALHPGDIICFDVHPGRIGGQWYRPVPCLDPEL